MFQIILTFNTEIWALKKSNNCNEDEISRSNQTKTSRDKIRNEIFNVRSSPKCINRIRLEYNKEEYNYN
jgi:hypothetical protein